MRLSPPRPSDSSSIGDLVERSKAPALTLLTDQAFRRALGVATPDSTGGVVLPCGELIGTYTPEISLLPAAEHLRTPDTK